MKQIWIILIIVSLASCKSEMDKRGGISITITNLDKDASPEKLKQDFATLKNRLDDAIKGGFEIRHLQNENTIKVSIPKEDDLDFFQWLLTAKGHFQLKETFGSEVVWENFDDIQYLLNDSNKLGITYVNHNTGEDAKRHLFYALHIGMTIPHRSTPEMGFADKQHLAAISEVLEHPDMIDVFPEGLEPMWTAFLNPDSAYSLIATANVRNTVRIENDAIEKSKVEEPQNNWFETKILLKPEYKKTLAELTKANLNWWIAITIDDQVHSYPAVSNTIENGLLTIGGFGSERKALALAAILNNLPLKADWDIAQSQKMGPQL